VDNASDENAFFIERATGSPTGFAPIAQNAANDTSYVDATVSPSTTYYYRVYATNLAGLSPFSNTNNATTTPPPTSLVWRGDGGGNVWDAGGAFNWSDGANLVVFNDGALALFDQSGSNNAPVTLNGSLQPNSVTVNASKNYTLTGNGNLAGSMALTKTNSGTLTVNTTNTFSGGINLNAGTISVGNSAAAGTGALRFNGGTLTFSGSGQPSYANALIINSNGTILSQGGNNNIVSGAWSGSAAATLNINIASGTFTIGGNMTGFPGHVALGTSGGTFRFHGSSGSANTSFDLGAGTATLNNRNGVTVTLGALSGGSGTFLSGAGANNAPSFYIVGGKNLNTTFAGTIMDSSSVRTTTITKVGTGTWTLTGNNTYSGATTVSAGRLVVNGNQSAATNLVTIESSGTLGGNGIIGGDTVVSGTLTPGLSIGTLTFTRDLTLNASAMAQFEISKSPFANDVALVASNLTFSGTLDVLNTSIEALEAGDNFQLFSAGSYAGEFHELRTARVGSRVWRGTSRNSRPTDGCGWLARILRSSTATTLAAATLIFAGTGGTPNWNFDVLTTTNLALPVATWSNALSGQFDASGNFTVSLPVNPTTPQQFYLLRAQ
jgi:autotransporter-associated beta strand protein